MLPKYKTVVFVHGCFWHRHEGCKKSGLPKSNIEFWAAKFDRNVKRDAEVRYALENSGWRVFVVWQCETAKPERLEARMNELVAHFDDATSIVETRDFVR